MRGFSRIVETFGGVRGVASTVGGIFIDIDRDKTAARLRLGERGAENGALDLPPSDSSTFDQVEAEIISTVGDHADRACIEAANELRDYNDRILSLKHLNQVTTTAGAARAALGDLPARERDWQNRLSLQREAVTASYDELDRFKEEHGLRRPARGVPAKSKTVGVILVAWLVDAAMNTIFLRMNDDMGILGGFLAAVVIAGFNVFALGYVAGRWILPQTHHRASGRRLAGWAFFVVWLGTLAAWNIVAAHYRDAKAAAVDNPGPQALRLAFERTLTFDDPSTYAFLVIGLIAGAVAMLSYLAMDDPYPGYGEMTRQHRRRSEDYADTMAHAKGDLTEMRDAAVASASATRAELSKQLAEHGQIVSGRASFLHKFRQQLDRFEREGNALLECYRLANRQARHTLAPAHFNRPWEMRRPSVADDNPLPPLPNNLQAQVTEAQAELMKAINDINDAFTEAEQRFLTLDELRAGPRRG